MSEIHQLLDDVSSDADFELRISNFTEEQLLELEALYLEHGISPSATEVDTRFGPAHSRVRQIDRSETAPLASELSFLADPGTEREWRGDTKVLWRIIEAQAVGLRALSSKVRDLDDKVAERNSTDLGLRLMLLRRELRDVVASLSEPERSTLLRLVVPQFRILDEPQKMRVNEGLVKTLSELFSKEIVRDAGRWIGLNHEATAHFGRALNSGAGLSASDSRVLVTILTSSIGYQFLQGSTLPFQELAFELFESLSKKDKAVAKTPST